MSDITVLPIEPMQTYQWLLEKHYAHRIPSIVYAFGLYAKTILIGCVTYGIPASNQLRIGVAGEEWSEAVIELNRLVIEEKSLNNSASILVGRSLKLLPKPTIVVSYADTSQGHVGYVYQATNFIYTGLSCKHKDMAIIGMEKYHSRSITRNTTKQELIDKWGDAFYYTERPQKHRYIYIVAGKKTRTKILKSLRYEIQPYPKGDTARYDAGEKLETQQIFNFEEAQ